MCGHCTLTGWLRLWALVAALALGGMARGEPAPTATLTVPQARALGLEAVRAGDLTGALGMAAALRAHDPTDPFAAYLEAVTLLRLGRPSEAERAARLSYRLGQSPEQRFQAARTTAMAAYNQQRYGTAQRWLRQAAIHAPTPAQTERTRAEFGSVAAKNPLSLTFRLSVTPSDNVNDGSSGRFNIIDGVPIVGVLSDDAQALSGVVVEGTAGVGFVLNRSATGTTRVGASVYRRHVALGSEAQDALSAIGTPDYGSTRIEGTLSHQLRLPGGRARITGSVAAGHQWNGSAAAYIYGRVALGHTAVLSDRAFLDSRLSAERRSAPAGRGKGDDIFAAQATLGQRLGNGDVLSFALLATRTETDLAGRSSTGLGGSITYAPARALGPARLAATLGYRVAETPGYTIATIAVPGGRRDETLSAALDVTLTGLEVGGFAPMLTLQSSRTRSNVSRFDTSETGVTIGFRSTF